MPASLVTGTDTAEAPRSSSPRYAIARGSRAARVAFSFTCPGSHIPDPGFVDDSRMKRIRYDPALKSASASAWRWPAATASAIPAAAPCPGRLE